MSAQVRWLICYGPLPVFCFYGFEAAVSAPCGRVANASFLACPSSACSGVWPFRIRCQQFRHHVEGLRTHRFWLAFFLACVLHALGTNLAAVRGFRKLRITSSTAFGVAVYWFRTQPRSEGAKRNVLWIPKVAGSIFLACVFGLPELGLLLLSRFLPKARRATAARLFRKCSAKGFGR